MKPLREALRLLALVIVCALALQLYFLVRVALMTVVDPQSTSFQRSEIWRLLTQKHQVAWSQQWTDYGAIALPLKRAVIASEDAGFVDHGGVEWDAIERARGRNQKAEARIAQQAEQLAQRAARSARARKAATPAREPKIVGGSTISQQLAKNLFLAGERTIIRKGQEFVVTMMLETLLSKQRILEIYLNNVEWGEGVFGAEAAARHYFHVGARQLGNEASARLAVMLPAPKRFEQRPGSAYVVGRASTVMARMGAVATP